MPRMEASWRAAVLANKINELLTKITEQSTKKYGSKDARYLLIGDQIWLTVRRCRILFLRLSSSDNNGLGIASIIFRIHNQWALSVYFVSCLILLSMR